MKKILLDKYFNKILFVFLLMQSVIDLHFLASYDSISIFSFSIPTLFRLLGVFIIGIFILFNKKTKENLKYISIYVVLVIFYFILHHLYSLNFTSLVPGNFSYSIKEELFYIIRLIIPIFFIFVSYISNTEEKNFEKLIFTIILFISGSIVISNLLKIGTTSYAGEVINGNIIDWFKLEYYDMHQYATKGWFANANAISAFLNLLLPISFYFLIIKNNKKWFLLTFVQMLSMLIIGTKVGAWGFIMINMLFIIIYLFFSLIKKDTGFNLTILLKLLLLASIFVFIYPNSPSKQRFEFEQSRFSYADEKEIIKLKRFNSELETIPEEEIENFKKSFIKNEFVFYSINPNFIENSYPYYHDPDFWLLIFSQPYASRLNYRFLEESMINRIKEIDNRSSNDLFGLTYSRASKVFTLEKDFVFQNYTLGYIGLTLFVLIYIILIIYISIWIIFVDRNKFTFKNITFIVSIGICFGAAYMSGNIVDNLMVMIIVGFIIGLLLKDIKNND